MLVLQNWVYNLGSIQKARDKRLTLAWHSRRLINTMTAEGVFVFIWPVCVKELLLHRSMTVLKSLAQLLNLSIVIIFFLVYFLSLAFFFLGRLLFQVLFWCESNFILHQRWLHSLLTEPLQAASLSTGLASSGDFSKFHCFSRLEGPDALQRKSVFYCILLYFVHIFLAAKFVRYIPKQTLILRPCMQYI